MELHVKSHSFSVHGKRPHHKDQRSKAGNTRRNWWPWSVTSGRPATDVPFIHTTIQPPWFYRLPSLTWIYWYGIIWRWWGCCRWSGTWNWIALVARRRFLCKLYIGKGTLGWWGWWKGVGDWPFVLEVDDCFVLILLRRAAAEEGLLLLHRLTHRNIKYTAISNNNHQRRAEGK